MEKLLKLPLPAVVISQAQQLLSLVMIHNRNTYCILSLIYHLPSSHQIKEQINVLIVQQEKPKTPSVLNLFCSV